MEKIKNSVVSCSFSGLKRSLMERLFCSFVDDLKSLIREFESVKIDQMSFIENLEIIVKKLTDLSEKGELSRSLEKAETIILYRVFEDVGT